MPSFACICLARRGASEVAEKSRHQGCVGARQSPLFLPQLLSLTEARKYPGASGIFSAASWRGGDGSRDWEMVRRPQSPPCPGTLPPGSTEGTVCPKGGDLTEGKVRAGALQCREEGRRQPDPPRQKEANSPGSGRPFPDFVQPGVLAASATAGQRPTADVTISNTVCQGPAWLTPWACGVGARGWPTIDFWLQNSVLQRASSQAATAEG